ncbi:MAG: ArsC family reductase [Flavipsychrobacter sp.]|nr:ArsC family reductase [Flavipsychrobacter sp.]
MITIYGIKNCDTMQKAMKWLEANGVAYQFHDYRESGIDRKTITNWLKHLPVEKVINTRSTTFRELPPEEREAISGKEAAIKLIMASPTVVKRPLWDFGGDSFFLGWDEKEIQKLCSR